MCKLETPWCWGAFGLPAVFTTPRAVAAVLRVVQRTVWFLLPEERVRALGGALNDPVITYRLRVHVPTVAERYPRQTPKYSYRIGYDLHYWA